MNLSMCLFGLLYITLNFQTGETNFTVSRSDIISLNKISAKCVIFLNIDVKG